MKKLTILVASTGHNLKLANTIDKHAQEMGFESEVVSLVDLKLPLYSSEEQKVGIPESVENLTAKLIDSPSLVIVAPEYNGLIPPSLNNAIAWVSVAGKDWRNAFNGKPTLIATFSGGGGLHALMAMRQQMSYVGANVIGRQLHTNFSKELNLESLTECLKQL
jgi:NAD(P)H-dependent FMN reductase